MTKSILVVGDAHARPDCDNRRFDALANFIDEKRPDRIVFIGDVADMASLSSYDKGSVRAEGRRYADDIGSVRDATHRVSAPVKAMRERAINLHRRRYDPSIHITLGNHEERINRAANEDPRLHGHISIADLGYGDAGWEVVPFLHPLELDGIVFQHYFTTGIMGRPIGGDNHASLLIKKNFRSSVCGHSHLRGYAENVDAVGNRVFGLVAGCFDEQLDNYQYTKDQHRWWSGLCMLHDVDGTGNAEPAFYSMNYVLGKFL